MKDEAYLDGQKCAKRFLNETSVVSQQWWEQQMELYANGHFSTPSARQNFRKGWQSIAPPSFIESESVTLLVRLMNVYPAKDGELSPLEQEMYRVFRTHSSMAKITFIKETKICLTYEVQSTVGALNILPIVKFLKQHLVSYKVDEKQEVL